MSSSAPSRSPHLRRLLVALCTVLAVVGGLLAGAAPARADSSVAGVRVVPGATQVTATWEPVPGATSYRVDVATNKQITKSRKTTTTNDVTAVVTKLKKNKTYYVRVTATMAEGSFRSKVVKTRTTTASTGRGAITSVTGAGVDQVRVEWKKFATATSITLQLSFDNEPISKAKKGKFFEVKKLPATATSALVTIPAAFRPLIGSATGNPVYVRVVSYNGSKKSTSPIKYGWAGSYPAGRKGVRVATYNVSNVNASKAPKWNSRRDAIVNSVTRANADVLLVQEATTARTPSGLKQFEEVEALLPGYALAYDVESVGTTDGGINTKGDHIYYRTATVSVIEAGLSSGKALPNTAWGSVKDRYFSWALLEKRADGQRFYVVSLHLHPGSSAAVRALRRQVAKGVADFMDQKNTQSLPVIIGGDFNTSIMNVQDGPVTDLIKRGYVDAAAAPSRSGYRYSTSMAGWPSKPKSYAYTGTRIDYLLIKGGAGPTEWVNQVSLTSKGAFDKKYYGSDHAPQWADFTWR
ncbi:MAG: endonuclease/exonuclease/phosphatase family protein [Propionibacteriaceae bacterium]|nr:endonuclease/exonuclease/phosphatase family protein [Propionibacteriaceae bacterium]